MLDALVFAAFVAAVNPWQQNDPFPLPATYESMLAHRQLSLNGGYRGIFENWEVEGLELARPYERWRFFQEANPFVRFEFSRYAQLKVGARVRHRFGDDEVDVLPRFAYVDHRPAHTFIFGNFRASWDSGILYQPISGDDHLGAFFRVGRRPWSAEGFVSRPAAVGQRRWERYVAAARVRFHPLSFMFGEAQGLIDHAAGFDTAGLPYDRPNSPPYQAVSAGLYAELNVLGRNSGLHASYLRTSGESVWQNKTVKPHGRYRAAGLHLNAFNITALGEYRRVDPTYIAPQGPFEYRLRYPADRNFAPDAWVGLLRWFYPFHANGSLMVEVEDAFFVEKFSYHIRGHQNRATLALQAQF